jgi:hypothetical protein
MKYKSGINQTGKISRARGQIHSGSILLGFIGGAIVAVAIITATSQSRLSAKALAKFASTTEMSPPLSTADYALII